MRRVPNSVSLNSATLETGRCGHIRRCVTSCDVIRLTFSGEGQTGCVVGPGWGMGLFKRTLRWCHVNEGCDVTFDVNITQGSRSSEHVHTIRPATPRETFGKEVASNLT